MLGRAAVKGAGGQQYDVPAPVKSSPWWWSLTKALVLALVAGLWYALSHPVLTVATVATLVLLAQSGPLAVALTWVAAGAALMVLRHLHPASFGFITFRATAFVRGGFTYRRRWAQVMHLSGLTTTLGAGTRYAPQIVRLRVDEHTDRVRVKLLPGQTPDVFESKADELAHAFGAQGCRIRVDKPGVIWLDFARRDALAAVVPALDPAELVNLEALPIGVRENGAPWLLRLLYTHVLLVGATGAGKGSVLWSLIRALGPSIRDGITQVWACDPKGGIELSAGQGMFTRFAYQAAQMVQLVEDAAALVEERAARLRGVARTVVPTVTEPLVVLVIDELAYLTSYMSDKDLRKRLDDALQIVLSQGRAVAVSVVGAVQDPRKEVVKYRDLFPTRIALRLTEASQVALTLGDGAHERGAVCERIPLATPGVGYVLLEGHREPTRVRAAYVTDDDITAMARDYPCGITKWRMTNPGQEAA